MRTSSVEYTPVSGTVKVVTKRALLFITDGEEHWIPLSVVFEDDLAELEVGVIGEINVAQWFYDKELA